MLAQEAHRRLGERIGFENVALITGEERVNEGAPIVCCTVEMAPQSGELLVLDEIQWADDEERGSAWTTADARGRVPRDPPPGRARRASARRARLPRSGAEGLRADAPARVGRRAHAALARHGHGRRGLQPQGGARARRRGEPAASRPRRRAVRRDAAGLEARGDRPLPLRAKPTSASPPTCSGTA